MWQNLGALTVHAFPMRPGAHILGVLSFYSVRDTELPEPTEIAQFLADAVGAALLQDPGSDDRPADSKVWATRGVVHQATGMLIAQLGLPAADALALLRAHAYAHDITLAEIAHQVVDRRLDVRRGS